MLYWLAKPFSNTTPGNHYIIGGRNSLIPIQQFRNKLACIRQNRTDRTLFSRILKPRVGGIYENVVIHLSEKGEYGRIYG